VKSVSLEQQSFILEAHNDFDLDKGFRYRLFRKWDNTKPKVVVIMFNPREVNPNPFVLGQTLGKIARLLVKLCGSIEVVNLFAKTSDSKKKLPREFKKFDNKNFEYIQRAIEGAERIVLFWGNGGTIVSKDRRFIELLQKYNSRLWCFGVTNKFQPEYIRTLGDNHDLLRCEIDEKGNIRLI
jgi:hypothetical protein